MRGCIRIRRYFLLVLMSCFALAALIGSVQIVATPAMATERPAVSEKNPPGDIPDSQVFVSYRSPLGFSLKVPEGWARMDRSDGASFSDKYNRIDISVTAASGAPTVTSATNSEAVDLVKAGRAVKIEAITKVMLRSDPALLIVYTSNSTANAVTNKQLRLENNRYLIYRGGKLATLDLSAPLGADNADQWKLMSDSFQWR